jgi:hypothetical protein
VEKTKVLVIAQRQKVEGRREEERQKSAAGVNNEV